MSLGRDIRLLRVKKPPPSIDDLVGAGFFYTGTQTIVTCFYCNGSLQNWGPNDNPMIEHARWFPQCAYAKQLCGDDLYRQIQESKGTAQEHTRATHLTEDLTSNNQKLEIPDESTRSELVTERLDWPISRNVLKRNFELSLIKRCWEDQLRLKQEDFVSDCDLLIACTILQKMTEQVDKKKENIIVPSVQIKKIRGQAKKERPALARKPAAVSSSSDLCMLCQTKKNHSTYIPCGHRATCISCGCSF